MTVIMRKKSKRTRKPIGREMRNPKSASISVVHPSRESATIQRGRPLAAQIGKELAALNNESLNETMSQLRGREWS